MNLLWLALVFWASDSTFDHGYRDYARFLDTHVHMNEAKTRSVVDYAGAKPDREVLSGVLAGMAGVTRPAFDAWSPDQQLAFLINLYNAATLDLILAHYPDLDSIRDLGSLFTSPWEKPIVSLFGKDVTLDYVEHELIRGQFDEPRIHAAVNCASCGCPALLPEPFLADRLDEQLDQAMRGFLRDRSRNRVLADQRRVAISKIFDWYETDFTKAAGSLESWLARYTDALADDTPQAELLKSGKFRVRHTDYDWTLNDVGRCGN